MVVGGFYMQYKYSEEEIAKVKKVMDYILDDMRDFYKASNCDVLEIKFNFDYKAYHDTLEISDDSICYFFGALKAPSTSDKWLYLEEKKRFGKKVRYSRYEHDLFLYIIREYEEIRKILESKVKEIQEKNNNDFSFIDKMLKKYDKEASIDINLPPSKNLHQLEVVEKEGKKIGTIDFGDRTIQIITNGDIVLVNKDEVLDNTNVKQKSISN